MLDMENKCEVCGIPMPDYKPMYCCSEYNRECDCQGRPMNPCVCSDECERILVGGEA